MSTATLLQIKRLALEGFTAGEIEKELPERDRPSKRTIYRVLQDDIPPDPSGTWKPLQSPVSAGLVLPVLARVVEMTSGRRAQLTNAEAARVEALREAVPDLPPWETYGVAQAYGAADYHKRGTEPIDMLLAFAPWRSSEHGERYFGALNRGWVQMPDLGLLMRLAVAPVLPASGDQAPEMTVFLEAMFFNMQSGELPEGVAAYRRVISPSEGDPGESEATE